MDGRHHRGRRLLLAVPLALALSGAALPGVALAADEPNGHASCMGLEQASISPPGTSDEEPGGAPQFVGEVKGLAAFLGVKPGTLFSFIAGLHAGSHADCDEALEG
jgi:hypothetical protein